MHALQALQDLKHWQFECRQYNMYINAYIYILIVYIERERGSSTKDSPCWFYWRTNVNNQKRYCTTCHSIWGGFWPSVSKFHVFPRAIVPKTLQDDALLPASWTRSTASRVASLNAPQAPFSRKSSMVPLISSRSTFHQEAMILLRNRLLKKVQNQGFQKPSDLSTQPYGTTKILDGLLIPPKAQHESRKADTLVLSRPNSKVAQT